MKISRMLLAAVVILLGGLGYRALAQTATTMVYTVESNGYATVNGAAGLPVINQATSDEVGTMGYQFSIKYYIPGNIAGTITWIDGVHYSFTGTFVPVGTKIVNRVSYTVWAQAGTFDNGRFGLHQTFLIRGSSGRGSGGVTVLYQGGTVTQLN